MNESYSNSGCSSPRAPITGPGVWSSDKIMAQAACPPRPIGPVESEALRTCQLANGVLSAIDDLARRIAGILGDESPDEGAEKSEQPSCELHGKLTNTCENLELALRRIQRIHSRVRL